MTADGSRLRARLRTRYDGVAVDVRDEMARNLAQAAPVDTGRTKAAVHGTVTPGASRYRITLEDPEPAAHYTNDGTRPHVIRPRNKRALAFVSSGVRVIVTKVNHPGQRATHWWDQELTLPKLRAAIRSSLARRS